MRNALIVQENQFGIEKELNVSVAESGFIKMGIKKMGDIVWFCSNCNKLPKTELKLEIFLHDMLTTLYVPQYQQGKN